MAKESVLSVAKRRGLGVLYLVLIGALLWLSIAIYQKKFTPVVLVSLKTDHTGNSLQDGSDVKERGIIVGSVRSVQVDSGPDGGCINQQVSCVTVTLALDPSKVDEIPEERVGADPAEDDLRRAVRRPRRSRRTRRRRSRPATRSRRIARRARSRPRRCSATCCPLLQAVKPAELNATLTAVATALQGRGEELGKTLVAMDTYLKGLNPHTKNLVDDLGKLGQVSDEYNAVAPDLFATIDNLQTSAKTVIAEKQSVANLFDTATSTRPT